MMNFTRREMVFSAVTASLALGASGRVTFMPSAIAREATELGYHKFKVGDIEVTTVFDGVWEKEHDPGSRCFTKPSSTAELVSPLLLNTRLPLPARVVLAVEPARLEVMLCVRLSPSPHASL